MIIKTDPAAEHAEGDDARAAQVRRADAGFAEDQSEHLGRAPEQRAERPALYAPVGDQEDRQRDDDDERSERERHALVVERTWRHERHLSRCPDSGR